MIRNESILILLLVISSTTFVGSACSQVVDSGSDPSALQAIESERGGRHWVDAATEPPMSPAESLAAFQIEDGFRIELVAAEPLVMDPVAIEFDHLGRMFVVEFSDYPVGPTAGEDPLSKIICLEDVDGDGKFERRHVFADKLDFVNSIMPFRDGLLVGAKTKLVYMADTDGDYVADHREVLFDGFTPAHPQMQICNPRWGIDNWIYCNYGPGKITTPGRDQPTTLPRKDFRFHPLTMEFGPDSGLGQFGNTVDRWGNRFYCLNRNPIQTTLLSPTVIARNPYFLPTHAVYDVGKAGGQTRVYPLVKMKSNYLSHAGTHTAACGTTAYLGEFGDQDVRNSVFVCEPIGHLVTRSIVGRDGLALRAIRARPRADFLASTDTWFRPSSLTNGPDGALYLADMYRLWVEHPKFLPPEIAEKLDWRAGEDRGRIYRIVPADFPSQDHRLRAFEPPVSISDVVALLSDSNGWRRFLGQRLLVQQQSKEAIDLIRPLLRHQQAVTRLHAFWTLDGLGALAFDDLLQAIDDPHHALRRAGIRIAQARITAPKIFDAVSKHVNDPDASVRFQVALAPSGTESTAATELLGQLAIRDGGDPKFADGLITSTANRSAKVLSKLVRSEEVVARGSRADVELAKKLATIVGARGDLDELNQLLTLVCDGSAEELDRLRIAAISGLASGLVRHRGELGRRSLANLISDPPDSLFDSCRRLADRLHQTQAMVTDNDRPAIDRSIAVELLAFQSFESTAALLADLLSSSQPIEVQTAAIDVLARNGSVAAAQIIVDHWQDLRPTLHTTALTSLLRRPASTMIALEAMVAGDLPSSALTIDQRVLLLKHQNPELRELASQLFGGAVSANRLAVAKSYEAALSLDGSADHGATIFRRVCATCHRKDGQGNDAGPDLSDVRNRSATALLYDILDPNSKVDPQYGAFTVLTEDGRIFNGLLDSESDEAIVLRMAEGKRQTIGRGEIEQLRSSGVSLMPEGIEKEVTPQQMADLLAYLTEP